MTTAPVSAEHILNEIEAAGHRKVKVAIADMDGILRGKYLHLDKFRSAIEKGFGFCDVVFGWDCNDVCYDNVTYTGWHTGYPDAEVRLDLATYRHVPWDGGVPFFLGDFRGADGDGLDVCPRQVLKRVLDKAHDLGLQPLFGVEYEWFNFRETPQTLAERDYRNPQPLTPGMFGYSVLRAGQSRDYFNALMDELAAFGVPIEGLHTETGPGVFEAAILASDALEAADRALLFKAGVKEIAHRYGIMPSFMAKWNARLPGCSGHLHQSLWDGTGERNLFFHEADDYRMSTLFKQYVAGQMALLPELLAFYAPTINSYKRLVEGLWAPTRVTWGHDNRTSALRVISSGSKSTRLETRVTGSDINPYLAVAAALASGLWGVEQELPLSEPPIEGNAYAAEHAVRLPKNLLEATRRLADSAVARSLLGDAFVEHFVQSRLWEWRQYETAVTSWELERYFEII